MADIACLCVFRWSAILVLVMGKRTRAWFMKWLLKSFFNVIRLLMRMKMRNTIIKNDVWIMKDCRCIIYLVYVVDLKWNMYIKLRSERLTDKLLSCCYEHKKWVWILCNTPKYTTMMNGCVCTSKAASEWYDKKLYWAF